jgi:hypothetical protein
MNSAKQSGIREWKAGSNSLMGNRVLPPDRVGCAAVISQYLADQTARVDTATAFSRVR